MNSQCFFIKPTRVTICYVYPLDGQQGFAPKAHEFVQSYLRFPPGAEHDTVVVCNGASASDSSKHLFDPLPSVSFLDHDNSGWDIGGFQAAARRSSADLMVFFGAHTYFRRAGWLARMQSVADELGDTLYGATGNQGDLRFNVHPHVRTTAFWCSPALFNRYPHRIGQPGTGGQRYESEHGRTCLTNWVKSLGRQPWIVGFDSILPVEQCDSMPEGFHKGNQSNVLVGDRMTSPPFWAVP